MASLRARKGRRSDLCALLAVLAFATLLPRLALAGKAENLAPCCSAYEENVVQRKYFNRFRTSYQMVTVCRTSKSAVLFELKKGGKMCADPQIAWAKMLMARIDKVNQGGPAKNNRPQKQSAVDGTAPKVGTTTRSTTGALSSRPANATHREDTDIPVDSPQADSIVNSTNTYQSVGAGSPPSEGQTRRTPIAEGGANTVNPAGTVLREASQGLTESPEQQDSVENSPNSLQGLGTGSPPSTEQARRTQSIAEGETNTANPAGTVLREASQGLTKSPEQQGRGGSEERTAESRGAFPSPEKALGEGDTEDGTAPWPGSEDTAARVDERPRKQLAKSEVAVLILVPIVLILLSVIAYLYCVRRGRQGPKYQAAAQGITDGVNDAL